MAGSLQKILHESNAILVKVEKINNTLKNLQANGIVI